MSTCEAELCEYWTAPRGRRRRGAAAPMKTRVFVQRPPSGGTGNTPAEAPKYPMGGMDLARTPASGAGDGGSTPSHPTNAEYCALGYCIYEPQGCPWGDGGCARMAHGDDGETL